MIKEIFIKEFRDHIGSSKMIIAFTIIVTLMIVNCLGFMKDFSDSTTLYQKLNIETREALKNNSGNLWQLTFTNQRFIYPPSILGFLAAGYQKHLPNGLHMHFFGISNPEYFKKENIFVSGSMDLDWNNILIFFVSFICIFFSYNTFSGEKINGTLKLMMSNPVSKRQVIIGKYLGICFIVFIPFIIGVIITILVFLFSHVIQLSLYQFTGIIYYLFAAALFISLNVLIGMLISTLTSRSIVSLSLVMLIWLVFSIVVPGIGWIISKKTTPVESLNSINDRLSSEMIALGGSRWDDRWKTPTPEVLANKNHFDKATEISNRIWNNYQNSLFAQAKSGISVSKISPFQVFRFLGEKVADNGFFRYINFYNQVKDYHLVYKDFIINKDKTDKDSYHLIWNYRYHTVRFMSVKPVSFEEIPKFEYKDISNLEKIGNTKWELFILIIWNVLLFAGVFYAFVRYDVR